MSNPVNTQDHTVTLLRKTKTAAQQKREDIAGTKKVDTGNKSDKAAPREQLAKFEREIEDGNLSLPKIPVSLRIEMQQARAAKGWSQQELAKRLNLPVDMIKKYENGTIVPVGATLAKIKRCLSIGGIV